MGQDDATAVGLLPAVVVHAAGVAGVRAEGVTPHRVAARGERPPAQAGRHHRQGHHPVREVAPHLARRQVPDVHWRRRHRGQGCRGAGRHRQLHQRRHLRHAAACSRRYGTRDVPSVRRGNVRGRQDGVGCRRVVRQEHRQGGACGRAAGHGHCASRDVLASVAVPHAGWPGANHRIRSILGPSRQHQPQARRAEDRQHEIQAGIGRPQLRSGAVRRWRAVHVG